jgi:hypothetical protein
VEAGWEGVGWEVEGWEGVGLEVVGWVEEAKEGAGSEVEEVGEGWVVAVGVWEEVGWGELWVGVGLETGVGVGAGMVGPCTAAHERVNRETLRHLPTHGCRACND